MNWKRLYIVTVVTFLFCVSASTSNAQSVGPVFRLGANSLDSDPAGLASITNADSLGRRGLLTSIMNPVFTDPAGPNNSLLTSMVDSGWRGVSLTSILIEPRTVAGGQFLSFAQLVADSLATPRQCVGLYHGSLTLASLASHLGFYSAANNWQGVQLGSALALWSEDAGFTANGGTQIPGLSGGARPYPLFLASQSLFLVVTGNVTNKVSVNMLWSREAC